MAKVTKIHRMYAFNKITSIKGERKSPVAKSSNIFKAFMMEDC